jgi:hypothetical protein
MRPRIWFFIGFVLVFVGILLFVQTYEMLPSGEGVIKVSLWHYYGVAFHNAFMPHAFGPGTNSGSGLGGTLFFHGLVSVLGGLIFAGVAKVISKRKKTDV